MLVGCRWTASAFKLEMGETLANLTEHLEYVDGTPRLQRWHRSG